MALTDRQWRQLREGLAFLAPDFEGELSHNDVFWLREVLADRDAAVDALRSAEARIARIEAVAALAEEEAQHWSTSVRERDAGRYNEAKFLAKRLRAALADAAPDAEGGDHG